MEERSAGMEDCLRPLGLLLERIRLAIDLSTINASCCKLAARGASLLVLRSSSIIIGDSPVLAPLQN